MGVRTFFTEDEMLNLLCTKTFLILLILRNGFIVIDDILGFVKYQKNKNYNNNYKKNEMLDEKNVNTSLPPKLS